MSKKQLKTRIVDDLMTAQEVESKKYTRLSLANLLYVSKFELIEWLAKRRLIKNTAKCDNCDNFMRIMKNKNTKLGYLWTCKRPCRNLKSILYDSFFSESKLGPAIILNYMYLWTIQSTQEQNCLELNINKNTAVEWSKDIREICMVRMIDETETIGGLDENQNPIVVEIDESIFFKRKYNRGRLRSAQWVFGAVERNSKKCFLVPVENRTKETLLEIIRQRIRPGTRIISDGWRAYRDLVNDGNYEYSFVIHEDNFVSPNDPSIHTQNIENLWLHAKRLLRKQFGTTEELLLGYLYEFMFRNRYSKENLFGKLLTTVIDLY